MGNFSCRWATTSIWERKVADNSTEGAIIQQAQSDIETFCAQNVALLFWRQVEMNQVSVCIAIFQHQDRCFF